MDKQFFEELMLHLAPALRVLFAMVLNVAGCGLFTGAVKGAIIGLSVNLKRGG